MLSVERPTPTGRANYPQFHLTGRTLYLTDRAVYITYLYHNATAAGMAGRIITLSYRQSSLHYHITIYYIYYILHILYTTYTTYTIYYIYYILHILYTTYTVYTIYIISEFPRCHPSECCCQFEFRAAQPSSARSARWRVAAVAPPGLPRAGSVVPRARLGGGDKRRAAHVE